MPIPPSDKQVNDDEHTADHNLITATLTDHEAQLTGLGGAALLDTGTTAGTVATGDHTHGTIQGPFAYQGTRDYTIPGMKIRNAAAGSAESSGRIFYEPFVVYSNITIDRIAMEITTAAAASSLVRAAVYASDGNWVPAARLVDTGTAAADPGAVPALVEWTVNLQLTPGRYLGAWITNGSPSFRVINGAVDGWPSINPAASASALRYSRVALNQSSVTAGGFPTTGVAPDQGSVSTIDVGYRLRYRLA